MYYSLRSTQLWWLVLLLICSSVAASSAPSILSISPTAQSLANARSTEIVVTFDSAIDPLTITSETFQVFGRWSGVMSGMFVMENGNTQVRFVPDREFFAGEWITVSLSKGVKDSSGEPLAKGYTWNFWISAELGSMDIVEVERIEVRRDNENWVQTYGAHAGDVNGDGYSDLILPNEQTNDVRVFLNDGTGGYAEFTVHPMAGSGTPSPNEGADFNNDGFMDFAVGSGSGNTVNILLGDGAGGFSSIVAYTAALAVRGVAVMDLNGDGYTDVVTANRSGSNISLLLNQGNGTFGPAINMDAGGSLETACAAADANNDGIMDLFVGSLGSSEIAVLLGDGNGGLQLFDEIPAGGSSPWMVAVGDVDGDGNVDVVSGNSGNATVSVIRGDGAGNLLTPAVYSSGGSFVLAVDLGDLDGDNDLDMAVSNYSGTWRVYENDGTGTFANPQDYPASSAASCAIFHDRDNNGVMDMTGIDEIDDLIFLFDNASSGLLCDDITSIQAKCQAGGTILFRVVLLNSTDWAGTNITCTVDGDEFTSVVVTNGTHSRASFSAPGPYGSGDHAIIVTDPPCGTSHVVTCAGSELADAAWEEFNALWEGTGLQHAGAKPAAGPGQTALLGNYPNPFNPVTTIRYELSEEAHVTLRVYDMLGQLVRTLVDEQQSAGYRQVVWDGTNDAGQKVASGVYVYRMTDGKFNETRWMLLLK